jgi:uncharacterized protein (TIGR02246 family)
MRMRLSLIALALVVLSQAPGRGASAENSSAADEKAIREIEARWAAAWNRHDPAALAATYAPDADAINLAGELFQGRAAFQKSLEELHSGKTQTSVWQTERTEIKFLTPEIAVVHVYANSRGDRNPDGSTMRPRHVILTRVEVKREGKWLIVASQATNIVPRASAQLPGAPNPTSGQ